MHETIAVPLYACAEAAAPAVVAPEAEPAATTATSIPTMSIKGAVQNCRKAYNQAFLAGKARGASDCTAETAAAEAYCNALPYLTSRDNIRAFIACVTHAMVLRIIHSDDGLRLINAARAALSALPRETRPVGRPKSNFMTP